METKFYRVMLSINEHIEGQFRIASQLWFSDATTEREVALERQSFMCDKFGPDCVFLQSWDNIAKDWRDDE